MHTARHLLLVFAVLFAAPSSLASKEGVLSLGSFQLSSPGIGESGPVAVSGDKNSVEFLSLTVSAFGRKFSLSKEQLSKLRPALVNGVALSYEAGYKEVGGRTVYVILTKGFTSGRQEAQVVSVNEQGVVEVNVAAPR